MTSIDPAVVAEARAAWEAARSDSGYAKAASWAMAWGQRLLTTAEQSAEAVARVEADAAERLTAAIIPEGLTHRAGATIGDVLAADFIAFIARTALEASHVQG